MQEMSPAALKVGQKVLIESVALERAFPAVVRERYLKDNPKDGRFLLDDATGFDMTGREKATTGRTSDLPTTRMSPSMPWTTGQSSSRFSTAYRVRRDLPLKAKTGGCECHRRDPPCNLKKMGRAQPYDRVRDPGPYLPLRMETV